MFIISELDAMIVFDSHLNSRPYSCGIITRDAVMKSFRKCYSEMKESKGQKV